MKRNIQHFIGSLAFLIGVVLALVVGIFSYTGILDSTNIMITTSLVIIGLIVGLFNVTHKETNKFLMSGIVLIFASFFGTAVMAQIEIIGTTLMALLTIFVPAVIIVAIKNVFVLARD